ncbi:MAG: cellulase family glycosylhydrolase [Anaerolineales bacterium]|nr:cellulase family glycosylhydrolase [Anaerolineales bacterium]
MRYLKMGIFLLLTFLLLSCGLLAALGEPSSPPSPPEPASPSQPPSTPLSPEPALDKWSLWTNGTQLRGANTWQRIIVPELDGEEFLGDGYIGPPYTQEDFNGLAALGANYVNLSHPGIFTERPPYVLDEGAQANLDHMIAMAAEADLFVVITFRTGPGRSDFTFYRDGAGDWFAPDLLIESVWSDQSAQDAWAEMWRYTAERYRDNPVVVGYDLMCEPNANGVVFEIYEPSDFYAEYAGSIYDWNRFYPRIVEAVREVDTQTPILVGSMSWGAVRWLPWLEPVDDPRIVYMVHQYEPQEDYTHQEPPASNTYPGLFDLDWDDQADRFDRAWLDDYLSVIDDYQAEHGVPVSVNEFGINRWVPDAADFMRDEMELFEQRGMNHALWVWDPDWQPWIESVNGFNFRYGPDPENATAVDNELQSVITDFWARNVLRPSDFLAAASVAPLCADEQPPLVTDFEVRQPPEMDEPQRGIPFRDPIFGSCVVRVTDRNTDVSGDDDSRGMKNEYSRVQSFNADGTRILVRSVNAYWYLYDAATLQPLGSLPLDVEPRWDADDPNIIYFITGTRLMSYNLQTGEQVAVHDFATDLPGQNPVMVWTRYEGSPSLDSRYWGLMAEDQDWLDSAYLIYDLQTDTVIAMRDLRGWPDDEREADSVTISPLGNYFIVQSDKYCEQGQLGSDAHPCGLMVYDRDLQNGRSLLRIVGHSDTALDADGREVFVYQDIDTDSISMLDLETGEIIPLWPIDFSHTAIGLHFSGRAFQRPGWVLVSTHDGDPASYTWMDDQVFALELKPGGRVVRLAHTHSLVDENQEHDYWAEPHASVNQDFTRVLFTSNWGRSGTEEVEMFMIDLAPDWIEQLP